MNTSVTNKVVSRKKKIVFARRNGIWFLKRYSKVIGSSTNFKGVVDLAYELGLLDLRR